MVRQFDLEAAKFVKPIGIEHFFDAFSLEKKRPLKIDAASALNIQVKDVSDSLVVNQDKAKRFELTPVWAFFFNRWLHRISRILAVLGYEGIKKATPVVLHPKRKSSAHSL